MGEISRLYAKTPDVQKSNSVLRIQRTKSSQPIKSPADRILFLQRTIGNQAVQRLIKSEALQAKLKIGQPGDKYEQEADRVADAVMRMPEPGVQRDVEPEEEEEETLQTKPLAGQITPLVQKQPEPVEEEEEEKQIQPKNNTGMAPQVTPGIAHDIHSFKGTGQPLPASERAFFEPRFGRDFSNVRVHNDMQAAHAARSINARAFTHGHDVVFGAGHYSLGTISGRKLLAHELAHVVQQQAGTSTIVRRRKPGYKEKTFKELDDELTIALRFSDKKEIAKAIRFNTKLYQHKRSIAAIARLAGLGNVRVFNEALILGIGKYQQRYHLGIDGQVGPITWGHMVRRLIGAKANYSKISDAIWLVVDGLDMYVGGVKKIVYNPKLNLSYDVRGDGSIWLGKRALGSFKTFYRALIYSIYNFQRWRRNLWKAYPSSSVPKLQRQPEAEEEEETLQAKPLAGQISLLLQRQEEPEEEELQAKSKPGKIPAVTSSLKSKINSLKGGGQPLDSSTRDFFEPRFGADFNNVRIHSNSRAAHVARSINAQAFTLGRDVVFGSAQYAPGTSEGRRLMAHELTHVVQQNGRQLQRVQPLETGEALQVASSLGSDAKMTGGAETPAKGRSAFGAHADRLAKRGLGQGEVLSQRPDDLSNSRKVRLNFLSTSFERKRKATQHPQTHSEQSRKVGNQGAKQPPPSTAKDFEAISPGGREKEHPKGHLLLADLAPRVCLGRAHERAVPLPKVARTSRTRAAPSRVVFWPTQSSLVTNIYRLMKYTVYGTFTSRWYVKTTPPKSLQVKVARGIAALRKSEFEYLFSKLQKRKEITRLWKALGSRVVTQVARKISMEVRLDFVLFHGVDESKPRLQFKFAQAIYGRYGIALKEGRWRKVPTTMRHPNFWARATGRRVSTSRFYLGNNSFGMNWADINNVGKYTKRLLRYLHPGGRLVSFWFPTVSPSAKTGGSHVYGSRSGGKDAVFIDNRIILVNPSGTKGLFGMPQTLAHELGHVLTKGASHVGGVSNLMVGGHSQATFWLTRFGQGRETAKDLLARQELKQKLALSDAQLLIMKSYRYGRLLKR